MWFFFEGLADFECHTWPELSAIREKLLADAISGDEAAWRALWKLPKSPEEFDEEIARRAELAARFGSIDDEDDDGNEDADDDDGEDAERPEWLLGLDAIEGGYEDMLYRYRLELASLTREHEENNARIDFLVQHKLVEVRYYERALRLRKMEIYDERRETILQHIAEIEGVLRRLRQGNQPPRCPGA